VLKLESLPQRGWTDFETARNVIEGELGNGPYLFGEWFTAADVMIGSMFIWKRMFGGPPERPKLETYVDRLLKRPAAPKIGGCRLPLASPDILSG
jgi:glutathione S-transferase